MFNCPAKPVSPYFLATTPAIRPEAARSTLYIFMVLLTTFSFSIASDIYTDTNNKISPNGYLTTKYHQMAEGSNYQQVNWQKVKHHFSTTTCIIKIIAINHNNSKLRSSRALFKSTSHTDYLSQMFTINLSGPIFFAMQQIDWVNTV